MIRLLLIVGVLLLFTIKVKADNTLLLPDTVDNYQIILNGKIILTELHASGTISIDSISDKDTLQIYYNTDTPCEPCLSKIIFKDKNGKNILTITRNTDFTSFKLTGNKLKKLLIDNDKVWIYFIDKSKVNSGILLGILKTTNKTK